MSCGYVHKLTSTDTNASFLCNSDIEGKIKGFEKDMQVLKTKYATIQNITEALRKQVLRVSDKEKVLDSSFEGESFSYSLR